MFGLFWVCGGFWCGVGVLFVVFFMYFLLLLGGYGIFMDDLNRVLVVMFIGVGLVVWLFEVLIIWLMCFFYSVLLMFIL